MPKPKIELNLSEENEIGFKLKIEGSANDIGSSKPKIRFALTEAKSGKGWIFSTEKGDGDAIAVTIPSMKGLVEENHEYSGKLEVILGEHYFTPTEVDVQFVEPLKVEAAIVTTSRKKTSETLTESVEEEVVEEDPQEALGLVVESQIDSIIKKPVERKPAPPAPAKLTYNDLTTKDKNAINKIFVEKCVKLDPVNFKTKAQILTYMNEGTEFTRTRLKTLLGQSTKEYLNSHKGS